MADEPQIVRDRQSERTRGAPSAGTRIGRYVVERTLGSGGMGLVVAARHEQLGELAAIKLLHPRASKVELSRERFVREARATARIKSEHVVRILDAGTEESTGAPYIVMEYLVGEDLGRIVRRDGPLPVQLAADYFLQVCEAVAAAHAVGIIHRDLKPSNFFVTHRADGTPLLKVLDFGISKAVATEGEEADPKLTDTQAVFGSPTYMSPEQIRSAKNVDFRSDVWSLGVALFEVLTGRLPFFADNVAGLLASIVADTPIPSRRFRPDMPVELEALIVGCLEKELPRRVQSVIDVAARLRPFASAEGQVLAGRVERMRGSTPGDVRASSPQVGPPPPAPSSAPGGTGPPWATPDPSLQAPLMGGTMPITGPPWPGAAPPAPSSGSLPQAAYQSGPHASFGHTEALLSTTSSATDYPELRSSRVPVAVGLGLIAAAGIVGVILIAGGARGVRGDGPAVIQPASSITTPAPPTSSAASPTSADADAATPSVSIPVVSVGAPTVKPPVKRPHGGSHSQGGSSGAQKPDPTGSRY